jgi:hypothetical protein
MKLSQKLLALSGVAVADYACCAYDDYGIPSACGLSEKTPFAAGDWSGNECKAWEANVDASFDGNDNACGDSENWSSCGFQRHFPWQSTGANLGYDGSLAEGNLVFDTTTFTTGSGANQYTIGGAPFLGGVCKLFMPVALTDVLSVNIAGVHLSGSGTHSADGSYAGVAGSLHCFSVVNPSEFLSNDGNIHNGNVAGWRDTGVPEAGDGMQSDIFSDGLGGFVSETDRQQGVLHEWYFNSRAPQTAFGAGGTDFQGDSNVGPNFDVVAHFKHSFCINKGWDKEQMQMVGDWGSNADPDTEDYPLGAAAGGGEVDDHAHTDTVDKRFADDFGAVNDKYSCVGACNNDDGMQLGGAGEIVRWPNAGAWAGFYSFIACANVDNSGNDVYDLVNPMKYVFQSFDAAGDCAYNAVTGTFSVPGQACITPRAVVPSLANDDFRVEDCLDGSPDVRSLKARWNVRQAGSNIRNCGPGTLPDGDSGRCSWNWNFNNFSVDAGAQEEAEAFFERSSPRSFEPWQSGGLVGRLAQEGNPTDPIRNVVITTELFDSAIPANPLAGSIDLDIPDVYVDAETYAGGVHTFTLQCNAPSGNGARDTFPDCYQGEEIHYEWTSADNADSTARLDPWATKVSATF